MKKIHGIAFTVILLVALTVTPVLARRLSSTDADSQPPEFTTREWTEPELVPQEILDEFENGMTIEEFLIRNQGPIPNALLEYADMPVTVVVLLEKPSLIEYVNQEGLGRGERTDDQVSYVSELKSDQAAVLSKITAGRAGDVQQIGESFTKALNGFMLNVPASLVNEIRAISGVKSVTRAPEYKLNLEYSVPLINADDVWSELGFTGEGVSIAVIDTGIDYTHAMLGGSGNPADYAGNDPDVVEPGTFPTAKVVGGYDFAGTDYTAGEVPVPDDDPLDENGHGTHVASTAAGIDAGFGAGVAPGASLYALKVFGAEGSTNLTLQAIEWAMDPHGLGHLGEPVDVINMSLGADWGPADENDPEFQAVENATSIGVVVVAAAGNSGDSSYIVESPSTADSAISVAASSTGYEKSPFITYDTDKYISYVPSENAFTVTITAEMVDVSVSIDPTGELCTVPGGHENELAGKIALVSRGGCTFAEKINNAEALGAIAVVVYNNQPGLLSMITDGSTLPACFILQTDGAILKGYSGTTVSIGPDDLVRAFVSSDPADTLADFSSRGPRGFDSKLKPEVTAPGVAIYAAAMGSGTGGVSYSGTSMATPHVAGLAALMVEAHPDWAPRYIKAAMMNTAVDLAGAASSVVPLQGAGRVDAQAAATTGVVAYADPELVSLSWGLIEISEDYSNIKTITLKNLSDVERNFDVAVVFGAGSSTDGASLNLSASTVTVPASGIATVNVELALVAEELTQDFSNQEEYYGFVTFTEGGGLIREFVTFTEGGGLIRLPFYFVPRPYTEITESFVDTEFEVHTDYGYLELEQAGPIASSLWAYPVSLVSDNDPEVLDAGDLRYVGMDYGWYDDYVGDDMFVSAFAMWGGVHTNQPYFNEVDLYIDTPYGSVVDFNYNYGAIFGSYDDNDWIVVQIDFSDGMLYLASPYFIYADFNSGIQEWYLPAGWQYVADEFAYEVFSYDYTGSSDYAGSASFDITRPPVSFGYSDDAPQNALFAVGVWVDDWAAYRASGFQGFMLVDYNGKPGAGQSYFWELSPYADTFFPILVN